MNPEPTKPFQGTERFQIVRQLGAGGMGIVYEAIDRERNSRVALKTLQRLDPEQIYLFKQEFRSLANIVHKYLIPLYELIFDGEHWFFTMEQIEHGMEIIPYVRGTYDPVKPPMETGDRSGTSDQETPDHGETVLLDSSANANFRLDDWHEPTEITELHRTMVDFQRSANQSGKVSTTQADLRPESSDPLSDTVKFDPFGQTVLLQNPTSVADIVPCEPDEGVLHKAPPVREERLRKAMLEIVEGVAELHRHGKLHRDLKPGNILIRSDGRVVLLDFGLVTELNHKASPNFDCRNTRSGTQRSAHQTSDDRISGTISYMSPEQASSRNLTPASDWYSVGVILFYILTGRLPFCGSPMQILAAKCARNGPAPSEFCENIPKDLDALCRDLISLNPNERPSVEQIRARLRGSRKSKPADEYETLPQDIPFIGREAEMSVLHAALAKVVKGEPVVVRVQGRSGAGKSALVDRFLDLADTEFQPIILRGRCYEQESVPYKAVDSLVDSLTRYLLRLDPGEVDHFLPAGVSALARIFPVLKRIEGVAKQSDDSGQSSDLRELRDQAFAALKTLLGRLSRESPIIFSIDDLQWGDMDSSALLAYLVQSPDAPRLMLLMSYRSEYLETSNPLRALTNLPQSIYCRNHYQLEVGALLEKDTRDLICRLLGDTSTAFHKQIEWIQSEAGGSVYFIYELVRYLKSGRAPSSSRQIALDEVLWERVSRLLDRPRELLEVISVSGQPVRLRDAREASGHPTLPTQVVLQLRSEHLVRTTGPSLEDDIETFHDRIRESVVSHLPSDRRKHWHLQLALSLEKSGRSEADTLAAHFQQAGLPAKASQYYLEAA
ncbi:MAG: protein kinase domain-containing protein, partial [Gammaproteobacteria bacterium]